VYRDAVASTTEHEVAQPFGAQPHAVVEPYPVPPPYAVAPPPGRFNGLFLKMWQRSPAWTAPAAIATCFAGAAAYTLILDPTSGNASTVPTCLVKLTTGFDCPGCGGTRAFWYALHGNFPAAARHHALFIFALPFLLYLYVAWSVRLIFKRQLPQLRFSPLVVGAFLGAWLVFSIARNLPWAPFTWLYV
jgi:hypothetical protein